MQYNIIPFPLNINVILLEILSLFRNTIISPYKFDGKMTWGKISAKSLYFILYKRQKKNAIKIEKRKHITQLMFKVIQ